jgi:hypothetical protein
MPRTHGLLSGLSRNYHSATEPSSWKTRANMRVPPNGYFARAFSLRSKPPGRRWGRARYGWCDREAESRAAEQQHHRHRSLRVGRSHDVSPIFTSISGSIGLSTSPESVLVTISKSPTISARRFDHQSDALATFWPFFNVKLTAFHAGSASPELTARLADGSALTAGEANSVPARSRRRSTRRPLPWSWDIGRRRY